MKHKAYLVILATFFAGTSALAQGYEQRQENQERRIEQGVKSGELTGPEARRLKNQQRRIERMENRAEADGVVTKRERARIHKAENRASRNIYRKKHNVRDRN